MLEKLKEKISICKRCPLSNELGEACCPVSGMGKAAENMFIVGQVKSESLFIDMPICGDEKRMLDVLSKNCKIESFFLTNILKCSSDKYTKDDIDVCFLWLEKEVQDVSPTNIFTFGKEATDQCALEKPKKLSDVVGKQIDSKFNKKIIPMNSLVSMINSSKKLSEAEKIMNEFCNNKKARGRG